MEISEVKVFIHKSPLTGELFFAKDLETMCKSVEDYEIGLYGIVETTEGDILFKVDFKYDGEPYLDWHKVMHIISFLKFHPYFDKVFLDKISERYIENISSLK